MTPASGSSELYWYDPLTRRIFLSIYSLSPAYRSEILEVIRRFRPALIYGYTSAVAELARLAGSALIGNKDGVVVVVTSETMQEHDREVIITNLAGQVYNLYGSQEGNHMAFECEHRSWHIMPLAGVIEILDDRGNPATCRLKRASCGDRFVSAQHAFDPLCPRRFGVIHGIRSV